jgi:hypothetical protein
MERQTVSDLLERARKRLDRLEPAEALRAMGDGALLIDTRCAEARDPRLSRGCHRLILLCADGYSSSVAAATLQDLGFRDATDVIGGFTAWARAGLPVEEVAGRSGAQ